MKLLKLSPGPQVRDYADRYGIDVSDVIAWANSMINDPPDHYAKDYPTAEERMGAIKGYLKKQNEGSIKTRIKEKGRERNEGFCVGTDLYGDGQIPQ